MSYNACYTGKENPMTARLSTHVPGLDTVLHGGLPMNSTILISGAPGTGKTTLANQILFHNASAEMPALFISTVSEPQARLLQYIQQYRFFDINKVGTVIQFEELGACLLEKNGDAAIRRIEELVLKHRPRLLVVDSFRSLLDLSEHQAATRRAIFRLASALTSMPCTTLLVGEYQRPELSSTIESTIVDGIITLDNQAVDLRDLRSLRVVKLRGSDYQDGEHSLEIADDGIRVYPRFRTPQIPRPYRVSRERVRVGIPGFDDRLLPGGLPSGSTTLLSGDPGVGKTVTALHFLLNGAAQGETGLYITFQESPYQLMNIADNFNLSPAAYQEQGTFQLTYTSPVELDVDRHAYAMLETIKRTGARRVVIDSISDLQAATYRGHGRFFEFMYTLVQWFKEYDITAMLTTEMGSIFASELTLTGRGISHIADNILLLRYAEIGGEIRRALTMLSVRGSDHSKQVFEYLIDEANGPRLGAPLSSAFSIFRETKRM